jgi:hypothetical protein
MQWHLTVWAKKDRSDCFIAGHTHYITAEYMELSHRAVLFPYISPHILALAKTKDWRKTKENLIMFDHDTTISSTDLGLQGTKYELKKAQGMTPDQLYEKYQKAKVGIDLAMPGAERFIYEASLFYVCIITDKYLNGADLEDLPIPDRFRVPPNNLKALVERKDECLNNYDEVIEEFDPLRKHVFGQRVRFYQQVRNYYSNNVHIVTSACSPNDARHIVPFILATLFQIPFATLEIVTGPGVVADAIQITDLRDRSYMASVVMRSETSNCPRFSELLKSRSHKTSAKRTKYIAWIDIATRLARYDFVNYFATDLSLRGEEPSPLVSTQPGQFLFGIMRKVMEDVPVATTPTYRHSSIPASPFVIMHDEIASHPEVQQFYCKHNIWRRNLRHLC